MILRLEYERRLKRWPQTKLAQRSGVPQKDISLIERGRLIPTEDQLLKLANALLITPPSVLMKPTTLANAEALETAMAEREEAIRAAATA